MKVSYRLQFQNGLLEKPYFRSSMLSILMVTASLIQHDVL